MSNKGLLLEPYGSWNGKIIALSDGHGMETAGKRTPYIPEIGRQIRENEFNSAVVDILADLLRKCGFKVLLVAPTDVDTPLKTRTDLAIQYKVDAYIAVHYNAYDGKFDAYDPEGISVHIYLGQRKQPSGRLAELVGNYLRQGTPQKWRGIFENNFHEVREPVRRGIPAILTENGFMDNKREALLMLDEAFHNEVAEEHAKGICDFFGVKYNAEKVQPEGTYLVKRGDTLWGISRAFGTTVEALKKANGLTSDLIYVGQRLIIPGVNPKPKAPKQDQKAEKPKTYTVKKGDTLWGIAQKHGLTVANLKKYNGLVSDLIYPGQVLFLSGSSSKTVRFPFKNENYWLKSPQFKGEGVKILQQALVYLGIDPGPIDGYYGPKTAAAVKKFQLIYMGTSEADSKFGPKTRAKMDSIVNR